MQDLRLCLVQADLRWEDPEANRSHLHTLVRTAAPADVILLPEMFTSGFSMQAAALAEPAQGPTQQWMQALAAEQDALICGSIIATEGGKYYNRMLCVSASGVEAQYDKRHTFRMANEHEVYSPGQDWVTLSWRGWRILPQVCYDLRFPVWSRNRYTEDTAAYDLAIYVANWPMPRSRHWQKLLAARAIENQCYVAGVNRVGKDGNSIPYSGDSAAYNFHGEVLAGVTPQREGLAATTLSAADLLHYRQKFPAWMDADDFHIQL